MLSLLSLKRRLIAVSTAWIVFGMIAAWFVLSAIFQKHVTAQFYDELYVHLDELQRLADIDGEGVLMRHNLSDPRYDVARSGFYWEIQKSGNVLARSSSMQGAKLQTPPDQRTDVGVHTHRISGPTGTLLVAEKAEWKKPSDPPVYFIIGTDQRHLNAVLESFNSTLSWSLAGFGLSMVAAATLLILYAMRPLNQLRDALSLVRSGSAKNLPGKFPSEVQPLVDDLNSLLSAKSELIQRARTQAGNLAHGLKTSLAVLTDEAYRIGDQGLAEASAKILDHCRQMQAQIDYQTTRAKAVATRLAPGTSTLAREAADEVVSAVSRLYRDRGITFENHIPASLRVASDRQDLNEMLGNLVDNASKHAKSLVRLSVGAPSTKSALSILIEDDGPGLPPEAYDVVFNVGEQWDSQATGSGLGLAIVRDLAKLYGGDVRLCSSALGGLSVSLELPSFGQCAS